MDHTQHNLLFLGWFDNVPQCLYLDHTMMSKAMVIAAALTTQGSCSWASAPMKQQSLAVALTPSSPSPTAFPYQCDQFCITSVFMSPPRSPCLPTFFQASYTRSNQWECPKEQTSLACISPVSLFLCCSVSPCFAIALARLDILSRTCH
jgi:hypothetical protein